MVQLLVPDRVVAAYLEAIGCGSGLFSAVHPEDEMAWPGAMPEVAAGRRVLGYLRSGYQAWCAVRHAIGAAGKPVGEVRSFLDFASGWGRMTRFAVRELGPPRVWVSDIDARTVGFLAEHLGVQGFASCTDPSRLRVDRQFEVVYAGSLFSHLSARWFGAWLRFLFELVEPGGLLLLSTHGMRRLPQPDASGFVFVEQSETARLDPGDYGTAFVAPGYVRAAAAAAGAGGVYVVERELWWNQDLYAVVHAPQSGLARWTHAEVVRGDVSVASADQRGWARLAGGVVLPPNASAVRAVEVEVAGQRFTAQCRELGAERERPDFGAPYEWYLEGDAAPLGDGSHVVTAFAELQSGQRSCFDAVELEVKLPR